MSDSFIFMFVNITTAYPFALIHVNLPQRPGGTKKAAAGFPTATPGSPGGVTPDAGFYPPFRSGVMLRTAARRFSRISPVC